MYYSLFSLSLRPHVCNRDGKGSDASCDIRISMQYYVKSNRNKTSNGAVIPQMPKPQSKLTDSSQIIEAERSRRSRPGILSA